MWDYNLKSHCAEQHNMPKLVSGQQTISFLMYTMKEHLNLNLNVHGITEEEYITVVPRLL